MSMLERIQIQGPELAGDGLQRERTQIKYVQTIERPVAFSSERATICMGAKWAGPILVGNTEGHPQLEARICGCPSTSRSKHASNRRGQLRHFLSGTSWN